MDISSLESRIHTYRGSREGDTLQQSDPRMKPMAVTKQYAINILTCQNSTEKEHLFTPEE